MADRFRLVVGAVNAEFAKPYAYGVADCFLLGCRVADAVDATLGLVERYGGAYSTLKGAHKALRKRGFRSLSALFEAHLKPIAPAAARLGDLAIVRFPDGGEHVAVCLGERLVTKLPHGRAYVDRAAAISAFRTGD